MSNESASHSSIVPAAIAGILCLVFFASILPSHAAAQTVQSSNVQTGELIPPGQNTCPVVTVTSIQPYVYNGVLESFDVTISDTSDGYVGILSSINNLAIPLDQITRWAGSPSGLRIHVDAPDVTVGNNGAQVGLTLLSSLPGQPTCITSLSFEVSGYGMNVPTYSGTGAAVPSTSSAAAQGTPTAYAGTGSTAASAGTRETSGQTTKHPASTVQPATTSAMAGAAVSSAASSKFFSSVCSGSNAYRLWFILLVIYIIIVAVVVFAEPWYLEASVIGSTATILVPLLLLLIFWYVSDNCRAASWIPVIACIIAIVGLFLAFREYEVPPLLPAASEH